MSMNSAALHPSYPSSPAHSRYPLLDIFRVICAILVVLIHCLEIKAGHPFSHMIVTCFSMQAVPFFFIISGYFFSRKLHSSENKSTVIIQYVKKQLLLYFAWMIIELPDMLITYHTLYPNASPALFFLLLVRRVFFAGQGVYWYILVLAESCLIAGICVLYKKEKVLYCMAVIGLLLGFAYDAQLQFLFFGPLNAVFYTIFSWSNNILMKGLPFVALGVWFSLHNSHTFSSAKLFAAYILTGAVSILYFFYCYLHDISAIKYLFLYPLQAALLFQIAIQSRISIRPSIGFLCGEISSAIYFLHTIILYNIVNPLLPNNPPILLKCIIAVFFSLIIYRIAKKTHFAPLCWLLSISA